ncbi:MAG: transcription termination/antitermination protein NusG [Syntrophobacteraceae bacterium]|nr:transcription termination/antitermination protein NusG [Syntrophobacteraceae bacterium]
MANLKWYIVHTYSGFEHKVKQALEERVKAEGRAPFFGQVLVPTEQVIELVKGERKASSRKFYPGYILVQMELNDDTWHLVRHTPKVTGFIGSQEKPTPLSDAEAEGIILQMQEGAQKPRPKFKFEKGDEVRVIDGPFANFNGTIDEVIPEKGKVRVLVSIFGRSTPVELDFVQVNRT